MASLIKMISEWPLYLAIETRGLRPPNTQRNTCILNFSAREQQDFGAKTFATPSTKPSATGTEEQQTGTAMIEYVKIGSGIRKCKIRQRRALVWLSLFRRSLQGPRAGFEPGITTESPTCVHDHCGHTPAPHAWAHVAGRACGDPTVRGKRRNGSRWCLACTSRAYGHARWRACGFGYRDLLGQLTCAAMQPGCRPQAAGRRTPVCKGLAGLGNGPNEGRPGRPGVAIRCRVVSRFRPFLTTSPH